MSAAESIEEARDAAREWRALRQMPSPRVESADAISVHVVEVAAHFEARRLENDVEAVPPGSRLAEPADPDPWSIDVPDVPTDGEPFTTRIPLPETRGVVGCFVCKGARRFACDDCGGSGKKMVEEIEPITGIRRIYYVPCGTCAGEGNIRCDSCRGSAMVAVTRCLVVEAGTSVHHEIEHGGRFSPELVSEILNSGSVTPLGARVVAEVDDTASLTAALPPRVDAIVRGSLARADTPDRRTHGRRVRVHAGWIGELKLKDRVLHVWGSPPRVAGDDLPVEGNRTFLWVGLALGALGGLGAALYLLKDM